MNNIIQKLNQRLGYEFRDESLLYQALTHCSFGSSNNERLEYLGDSIVNFLVAEQLYRHFPNATEGQLTRLRAKLVRGKTLAQLAKSFELGEFLIMGAGELKSGGFKRDSILADAFEALVGALYLDAGMDVCRERLLVWYKGRIEALAPEDANVKDAKTRLQEYMQANGLPLPVYEVVSIQGQTHEQLFRVSCKTRTPECEYRSEGSSRRMAEQLAAEQVLLNIESLC